MIRIVDAFKTYGDTGAGARVLALNGVSLEIPAGQFVAIMGPSGCGKSTLLHVLGGLDQLDRGEIYIGDRAVHGLDETGLTQLRRRDVGIVFQFFNLLPTLTVQENVELPALLQGVPSCELSDRAESLLTEVGMAHRSGHRLHELSGGEMQRAALARALMMKPKVLLADEPTGNLDSEAGGRVIRLLRELGTKHGTTVVMVTHSREMAAVADRRIDMKDGQIVSSSAG